MSGTRIAIGLLAVAIGSAWFAGGTGGLRASGDAMGQIGPYLLVIGGLLLLLRTFAPRGTLTGPLLVISVGAIWLLARYGELDVGTFAWRRVLPVVIVVAGTLVALAPRRKNQINSGNMRVLTVLIAREFALQGKAPRRLSVSAILAPARVDLASVDQSASMDIDLSIFFGRIVIVLPSNCTPLLPGRLALARGIRFEGHIDELSRPDNAKQVNKLFVLNVLGLGGAVRIERCQASARPQGSPPSIDGNKNSQEMSS